MTARELRRAGPLVLVAAAVLAAGGCSTAPDPEPATAADPAAPTSSPEPSSDPGTTAIPSSPSTPPVLAGTSEAGAAAALPTGSATGTVVITYSGLGEVDSPFAGSCVRSAGTTTVAGDAGSASIELVFDDAAVTLTVQDEGLGTSVAQLGRAELAVDGGRLTLAAPLQQEGQPIGTTQVDVTCGN